MSIQQTQTQTQKRKRPSWVRPVIALILSLFVVAVIFLWILSSQHIISSDLASLLTFIFTVLAVVVPVYLWLFSPPASPPLTPQPPPPTSPPALPDHPEPASQIWTIPSRQNPFFTGREEILSRLHTALTSNKATTLPRPQAISGLGGIGKTQTAVEYAYRYRNDYRYVFWVRAETREAIISDFVTLASTLNLPEKDAQDQSIIVKAVMRWLETHDGWLLILDNADDLNMANDFTPSTPKGHILLTTRAQATEPIAQGINIERMEVEEGTRFLLRRAGILAKEDALTNASSADLTTAREIVQVMDGLPLALDQAGAYVYETRSPLSGYLQLYLKERTALLKRRSGVASDHPEPVATTWSLSFKKVEKPNRAAADLLRLCAFLAPDAIPEEIFTEGQPDLGRNLRSLADDPNKLNAAIGELLKYSLVRRNPDQTLTVHRLVQAVLKDEMDKDTQRQWAERAVRAVNNIFPAVEYETWPQCERYLPQARVCTALIEQWKMAFPEAGRLLNQAGWYLRERAQYTETELFSKRALAIREQVLGPEHDDVANSLSNLTLLYWKQGKYAQAEPLAQRALAIAEKVLGADHPNVATSLNNLALLYRAQGKSAQAEPFYQRSLAIREKALPPDHPDVANSLNNLGGLYKTQGKYAQAEPLYKRAIAIVEKELGPNHPYVATSLNNLAGLYHDQGKYAQAEPLYKRALEIDKKALGPDHPDVANSLNNLADLYRDQGKYAQAEPLYQRAIAIDEKALGPNHPDFATDLENYAVLLRKTKREDEAAKLEARAREIRERHARENPTGVPDGFG